MTSVIKLLISTLRHILVVRPTQCIIPFNGAGKRFERRFESEMTGTRVEMSPTAEIG